MLEFHLRKDIEFIPHPALDLFTEKGSDYQLKDSNKLPLDEEALNSALDEAKGLELDYRCVFNKLYLVEINGDFTSISLIREFELKGLHE